MTSPALPTHLKAYREFYRVSCEKRSEFWKEEGLRLLWQTPFLEVTDGQGREWFRGGRINACENALDRHVQAGLGARPAVVEIAPDGSRRVYSYEELLALVETAAAHLSDAGVKSGDVVAVFLPADASFFIAMLAAARIGAVSLPLSKRFSTTFALRVMEDAKARVLATIPDGCPAAVDLARECSEHGIRVIDSGVCAIRSLERRKTECMPLDAQAPLFLMYPGIGASTPRGYVYAVGGFLAQVQLSARMLFHSDAAFDRPMHMVVAAEAASLVFSAYALWGALLCADACLCVPDNWNWNTQAAALTAGQDPVALLMTPQLLVRMRENFQTLPQNRRFAIVGFFGDAISPRQLRWAGEELAQDPVHVLNLWTSAQTGCSLVSTLPHPELSRMGALGLPMPGVCAQVVNDFGKPCAVNESGQLVFTGGFPGCARTILGQPERFHHLHTGAQGQFLTHDGVRQDSEGFFWFMKRLDDVMKVDGASVSTSEVESVLQSHPDLREAAVIGVEGHEEGDCIVAFVAPRDPRELENPPQLEKKLRAFFEERSGGFQVPLRFAFVREMPRTRSGKVERRLLHRIATNDISSMDDLGHLMNPDVVQDLIQKGR